MEWFQFILDHPEKKWNWSCISINPNITWDIVKAHPNLPWNWMNLSFNKNITLKILKENPQYPWDWGYFSSCNPNLTWDQVRYEPNIKDICYYNNNLIDSWKKSSFKWIDIHPRLLALSRKLKEGYTFRIKYYYQYEPDLHLTWNHLKNTPWNDVYGWGYISSHPNITWDIIKAHPDMPWQWHNVSGNLNITWDIVQANPDFPWNWTWLSCNPNITWDIIQAHPEKSWDWNLISKNPNISWDIVEKNPDKPWFWYNLSSNPMTPYIDKKRIQARCKIIKEDLMKSAWHPDRIQKWLEKGGFELLEQIC
jgi:hypothetical protein